MSEGKYNDMETVDTDETTEVDFEDKIGLNFDSFEITTMTAYYLEKTGRIALKPLFYLLPWHRVKLPKKPLSKSSKLKIPSGLPKGTIVSLRHDGETRGIERIIKQNSESYFRNAIAIDVSTGEKSVCVKLFSNSIHVCGAKSEEMSNIAARIIYDHVIRIRDFMDHYDDYKDEITNFLKYVKGRKRTRIQDVIPSSGYCRYRIHLPDFSLIEPEDAIPGVSQTVYDILTPLVKDYEYYSQFVQLIKLIEQHRYIGHPNFAVQEKARIGMINYNYNLGFKVNRRALDQLVHGRYGFHSRFNNGQEAAVFVSLPYVRKDKRKSASKSCHTFMIQASGAVTQSGPDIEMMRDAFNLFVMVLSEIKDEIVRT